MQVRKFCLVVSFLIGCMPVLKAQTMTTQQYIAKYKDIAVDEMRQSGIPASIKLAQGILETQSGNGWLCLNSNNHFGIKCKNNWVGETVHYDDDAAQECFRKYTTVAESYHDHSEFLKNNPRYAFLFQFNQEDYKSWAYGLKQAGYATSTTYPQQLIKIIEDNNLQQYTLEGEGLVKSGSGSANQLPPYSSRPASTTGSKPATAASKPSKPISYPKGVFEINNRKVLYVPAGTSLIQIADKYKKRLSRLLGYNDLKDDGPLPTDMFIYLEKKGKKGKDDYHVVEAGETMYSVSQIEGVQLKWLRRRNKMKDGQEPAVGEKLALDGYANVVPKLAKATPTPDPEAENYSLSDEGQGVPKEQPQPARNTTPATPPPASTGTQSQGGIPAGMIEDLKNMGKGNTNGGGQSPAPVNTTPAPRCPHRLWCSALQPPRYKRLRQLYNAPQRLPRKRRRPVARSITRCSPRRQLMVLPNAITSASPSCRSGITCRIQILKLASVCW